MFQPANGNLRVYFQTVSNINTVCIFVGNSLGVSVSDSFRQSLGDSLSVSVRDSFFVSVIDGNKETVFYRLCFRQ